jgi:hypothetical protein
MRHYTLLSIDASLWLFAYCLTRKGQADFLDRMQNPTKPLKTKGFISDFFVRSKKVVDTGEIDDVLDDQVNELMEAGTAEALPDREAPQDLHEDEHRADDDPDEDVESQPLQEDELRDMKGLKPMKMIINLALDLLPRIGCPPDEIDPSIDFLKKYLTSEFRASDLSPFDERRFNWLALRAEDSSGKWIADLALRLEPSPCAEASCERTISSQRLILTSRSLRSKPKLLNARLTLMTVLPE